MQIRIGSHLKIFPQKPPNKKVDCKPAHEIEFQHFQMQYKEEVKDNYLVTQIAKALHKIAINQERCAYLAKQIDSCAWATSTTTFTEDVIAEFDIHVKNLITQCNSYIICAEEENWDCLQLCLKHLSRKDIQRVKLILGF